MAQTGMPKLQAVDGVIHLPIIAENWRPTDKGVSITGESKLGVRYIRKRATSSGIALPFVPGSLDGLGEVSLKLRGDRGVRLLVSLRSKAGPIHSWRTLSLTGEDQEITLKAKEIKLDTMQSRGKKDPFVAAEATALSLVDISAYFGAAEVEAKWTITDITASLSSDSKPDRKAAEAATSTSSGSAEEQLFQALVENRGEVSDVIPLLVIATRRDPSDSRATLLLGLAHLWVAAEGDRSDPQLIQHIVLAEHYLARTTVLDPDEDRVPSWLVPTRIALADIEGRQAETPKLMRLLSEAFEEDPGFHGFSLGLLGYTQDPESKGFEQGLKGLHKSRTANPDDPSVQNRPNWPHNREGFLLFLADYEKRAGNDSEAKDLLTLIEKESSFASWPFRAEVDKRRRAWRAGKDTSTQGAWMQAQSCVICHRRQ
jgi:hypothetical protein